MKSPWFRQVFLKTLGFNMGFTKHYSFHENPMVFTGLLQKPYGIYDNPWIYTKKLVFTGFL